MNMTMCSDGFGEGQTIPRRYGEDGEDVSPPLTWSGEPAGTLELALIVDDPDAPSPKPWVHWILYKIPPEVHALPEGVAQSPSLKSAPGAKQGKNSWGGVGYRGPAPPRGHGMHHYHFHLYALDSPMQTAKAMDKEGLLREMQGHILAQTELVGTYER